jgi:hypothetical protein
VSALIGLGRTAVGLSDGAVVKADVESRQPLVRDDVTGYRSRLRKAVRRVDPPGCFFPPLVSHGSERDGNCVSRRGGKDSGWVTVCLDASKLSLRGKAAAPSSDHLDARGRTPWCERYAAYAAEGNFVIENVSPCTLICPPVTPTLAPFCDRMGAGATQVRDSFQNGNLWKGRRLSLVCQVIRRIHVVRALPVDTSLSRGVAGFP